MKRGVVFACPMFDTMEGSNGLFNSLAPYHLQSYINSQADITQHIQCSVVRFMHSQSVPVFLQCRNLEHSLTTILASNPIAVCFSLYVWTIDACHTLAQRIHEIAPDVLTIAGGPEVAERPEFVADFPCFDVVVQGDGEIPLAQIMRRLASGSKDFDQIPSVSFKIAGEFIHTPFEEKHESPDKMPNVFEENRDLIGAAAYLLQSRGCSGTCTYCFWRQQCIVTKGRDTFIRELDSVLAAGVTEVFFSNSDFFCSYQNEPELFWAVATSLSRYPHVSTWIFTAMSSLDSPALPEMLKALQVGWIQVGVQSFQPHVLKGVGRSWSIEGLEHLARAPIETRRRMIAEVMFPLPGETLATFLAGCQQLIDIGIPAIHCFPVSVLRGTPLREQVKKNPGFAFQRHAPYFLFETPTFSRADWLDASYVAYVLTALSNIHRAKDTISHSWLDAILCSKPDIVATILGMRKEMPLPGQAVEALVRTCTEMDNVDLERYGPHVIGPIYRGAGYKRPQIDAVRGPASPQLQIPSESVLTQLLAEAGCTLGSVTVSARSAFVSVCSPTGIFKIEIFSAKDERQAYAVIGPYKLSYVGQLNDISVLDRIVSLAKVRLAEGAQQD